MDLSTALNVVSHDVNQTIKDFFLVQRKEAQEVEPSLARSVQLLEEFSLRGGKFVRSFLTLAGFYLANGKAEKSEILKAAAAVELHHKHILILDDISDRDGRRYGGPTLEFRYHDIFGTDADGIHRARSFAMLDGVLLGSLARELLLSAHFPPELLQRAQQIFNTVMYRDTLAGWQIHGLQALEPLAESTEEQFIKGLRLVTASYTFEGPLVVGLMLADNTDAVLEQAVRAYSAQVGTAFQIQDDILGLFGDPKETGKPVGNDIREGKKTLLLQYAYRHANTKDKALLEEVCGRPITPEQLTNVQHIITETGSLEHSKKLAKEFIEKGIEALSNVPESPQCQVLIDLAHYIISRTK